MSIKTQVISLKCIIKHKWFFLTRRHSKERDRLETDTSVPKRGQAGACSRKLQSWFPNSIQH